MFYSDLTNEKMAFIFCFFFLLISHVHKFSLVSFQARCPDYWLKDQAKNCWNNNQSNRGIQKGCSMLGKEVSTICTSSAIKPIDS